VASTILQVREANASYYITPTIEDVMAKCGAHYCNDAINNTNLDRPSDLKVSNKTKSNYNGYVSIIISQVNIYMYIRYGVDNREF
jgi:hypothetical protein